MRKEKILFINYLVWRPEHTNVICKYEALSKWYSGVMLHISGGYYRKKGGNFVFLSQPFFENRIFRQLSYVLFCIKQAYKFKPFDYIITYDPLICGLIGVLIKFLFKGKLIVEVNSNHIGSMSIGKQGVYGNLVKFIKERLIKISYGYADGIKFISKDLYEYDRRLFKLDSKKSEIFFDFVPTDVFKKKGPSRDGYVLLVGYPYHIKGVDVLIKAFNLITNDYPGLKLKVIGHCEDRTEYEAMTGGNTNIMFYPGMKYEQIIPEFENCRIFVLPSRTEAMGRVLIEAMACGKPVIGSNVGGIPGVIEDGVNGFLFESENHEMLAEKMRRILDNDELAQSMGESGYKIASEKYSTRRYAELYHRFLSSIQ